MKTTKSVTLLFIMFLLGSCASFDKMNHSPSMDNDDSSGINIFLVGDAGKFKDGHASPVLRSLHDQFKSSKKEDVLLFLGDNIYPNGMPAQKSDPSRDAAEKSLQVQIDAAKTFKGSVFFIPGNHDWYSGLAGLAAQQKIVEKEFGKNSFLPSAGCPLDQRDVTDDIVILFVDSEWYLTNWDKHPAINDDCLIRTREQFIQEFKSLVNKNQNKTVIVAMHHPLETNGSHGGQYPFSILKAPLNFLLKTSGASPADRNFPLYSELSNKITTILQSHENNVIVVSGHDHNLQYNEENNIPQIISGSGSKVNAVRHYPQDSSTFGYGGLGYASINIQADKSQAFFYDHNNKIIFTKLLSQENKFSQTYPKELPPGATVSACIYTHGDTKKELKFKQSGHHMYRAYYYNQYRFPTVNLDTLYGGVKPVKIGGGNQSVSLRLSAKNEKEYVMRRLRKSATQFIQAKLFTEEYVKDRIANTGATSFLMDFYTSSYPFAPLVMGHLSDIAGVFHPNSRIYYVPKQAALGKYNEFLGDDLYLIEEHLSDEHQHLESFGDSDDIVSSDEVLENLMKDEKYKIDHRQYIITRLFDMWVGDWDRHEDQYKWAAYDNPNGTVTYAPIPRDRDQAFPRFGKFFTGVISPLVPPLQSMQSFEDDIKNVNTFNTVIYRLDKTIIHSSQLQEWLEAAVYLEAHLTDDLIEDAFSEMPLELRDSTLESIISNLKSRRQHISEWAEIYYKKLNKNIIVTGTDKDDLFTVTRLAEGKTRIFVTRLKKETNSTDILFDKTFSDGLTKEIWLYGLDDQDQFSVVGDHQSKIKLRLIGGQHNDNYAIENPKNVKVYDYKSKPITLEGKGVKKYLTDQYDLNNYNFHKYVHYSHIITPVLAFNPDEGVILGATAQFIKHGFENNPFTYKHIIGGAYFTASDGFAINYTGEFANVFGKNNFKVESFYTTPAFSQNFFGYGNETEINAEEESDIYYRTRLERLNIKLSHIRKGRLGSEWKISLPVGYYNPSGNEDRFVRDYFQEEDLASNLFAGIETSFFFENKNSKAFSTQGMSFDFVMGWKQNLEQSNRNFGYLKSTFQIDYPLVRNKKLTLSTAWHVSANSNNTFEFYQSAYIGGRYGLRGFPNQRFSGKTAYYQNTDLRFILLDFNTGILPGTLGIYTGFDYGRVWESSDPSKKWHTSYGGGVFVSSLNILTIRASFFASDEGGRFVFGLGFDF